MNETQLFDRLILIIIFGIFYVLSFVWMAERNNQENENEKHPVLKILGYVFMALSFIDLVLGLYRYATIDYLAIDYNINEYYFVVPTPEQYRCIANIKSIFVFLALSGYCFFFKSSDSTTGKKVLKIVFGIIYFSVFVSSTNLYRHDPPEYMVMGTFIIMFLYLLISRIIRKKDISTENVIVLKPRTQTTTSTWKPDIPKEESIKIESDHAKFMPPTLEEHSIIEDKITSNLNKSIEIKQEEKIEEKIYCRFCGEKIDYSGQYCKHCGKKL